MIGSGRKLFLCLLVATVCFVLFCFLVAPSALSSSAGQLSDHGVDSPGDDQVTGSWMQRTGFPTRSLRGHDPQVDDVSLDEEMARRRLTVDRICRHLWLHERRWKRDPKDLDHIIVDDRHRLLYCSVAKVASTNWKRILMILQGNVSHNPLDIPANESHRPNLFRTLDGYDAADIDYRLRHYFKFVFVRHPFERVLSAFRNKFERDNDYFHRRFGRLVIQRFRENATEEALADGANVTFTEFASYLADPRTRVDGPLNEHWRPVYDLCHPCAVRYDVIGRYDALDREAPYVLQRASVDGFVQFPRINRTVDTFQLLEPYFRTLTREQVFRLYQMYTLDFKMFGYPYPDFDSGLRGLTAAYH